MTKVTYYSTGAVRSISKSCRDDDVCEANGAELSDKDNCRNDGRGCHYCCTDDKCNAPQHLGKSAFVIPLELNHVTHSSIQLSFFQIVQKCTQVR